MHPGGPATARADRTTHSRQAGFGPMAWPQTRAQDTNPAAESPAQRQTVPGRDAPWVSRSRDAGLWSCYGLSPDDPELHSGRRYIRLPHNGPGCPDTPRRRIPARKAQLTGQLYDGHQAGVRGRAGGQPATFSGTSPSLTGQLY
jgi:hypothetical protein